MKRKLILARFAWAVTALLLYGDLASCQVPDIVKSAQQRTTELTTAERAVIAARNALQAAKNNLDTTIFNSPAYNARITAEQVKAAKARLDQAGPNQKEEAQEKYELALELAERRKAELEAAEKLLPQREAAARAAEEKYASALPAADKIAGPIKAMVREAERDLADKTQAAKLAIEKAAFTKANADKTAQANAAILKAMAELVAADKAVREAGAALQKDPKKAAEAEKATQLYAAALQAVVKHIPSLQTVQVNVEVLKATAEVIEADKAVKETAAALQKAKTDLQNKTNAAKAAADRVQAALARVDKAVAKIAARKVARDAQALAEKAEAARAAAEKVLPPLVEQAENATKKYAAALQAAVKVIVKDADRFLDAARAAIARAMAEKETAINKENEAAAREAAEAKAVADKADAARAAAEKVVVDRTAVRQALEGALRNRFYREVGAAQQEISRIEAAISASEKTLQARITAWKTATAAAEQARAAADKARTAAADAQAALVKVTTREKAAAEKLTQDTAAATKAAEQKAAQAQAAAAAARQTLKTVSEKEKSAAEKLAQETAAAAKAAQQKATQAQAAVTAARAALDKILAREKAAEKLVQTTAAAARDLAQKAAPAQAALDKATAEKAAAEQAITQQRAPLRAVQSKLETAKAAAQGGLKPLPESAWDYAKARHLLVRAGFGGTPDEVARLHAMGPHGAVDYLVNFKRHTTYDLPFAASPRERPLAHERGLSGNEQAALNARRQQKEAQQIQNMRNWWIRRMIESPRPLEEKLTLFWHGHLATQYSTAVNSYYMYRQNQLFRANAAGNFATLLHGITHDAAMLNYLNNDTNVKGRANENLARELMELFSMGRDQGYTEIDIRQGARALTGYTYDFWTGQFRFIEARHDEEPKTIFGKTGNWCGDDFAALILETLFPPKFIARQLFKFFVHDEPTIDTIEALANVLRLNNYELAPMLENLFASEEFYSAQAMGTQIKGPIQLLVGLHRDLGLKDPNLPYLVAASTNMGQQLFEPPSVFGWPAGRAWVNSARVFSRYNALADVLESVPRGGKTGVDVVGTVLAGKQFQTHAEVVDYLVRCCMTIPLPDSKRQALIEFLSPLPPPTQWEAQPGPVNARLTRLLVFLICSPEYQLT
jgi:uncharacterized protein (DUF1800 family)